MDDFKNSVTYEDDLPRPHRELEPFVDEERPSNNRSLLGDLVVRYGSHSGGGMMAGFALNKGLQHFDMFEVLGLGDQTSLLLAPIAGAAAGTYVAVKKHQGSVDENIKWREAQRLEETVDDFSDEFADQDFVIVRDYILGEGEPIERTGEVASALYDEVRGLEDTQLLEENPRGFPEIDYQLSLFDEGEPLRSFYVGEDLVEGSYPEARNSFVEDNRNNAVSLKEFR